MKNLILLLVLSIISLGFPLLMKRLFKGLKSISDSVNHLIGLNKSLFTLFCWGLAIPVMHIAYENKFMFYASFFILFLGLMPLSKNKIYNKIHYFEALIGIVLMYISIYVEFNYSIIFILSIVFSLIVYFWHQNIEEHYEMYGGKYNNPYLFWIEYVAIIALNLTVWINYIVK